MIFLNDLERRNNRWRARAISAVAELLATGLKRWELCIYTYCEPSIDTLGVVLVATWQSPDDLADSELIQTDDTDDYWVPVSLWVAR